MSAATHETARPSRSTRRDFMRRVATVLAAAPVSGVLTACESLPPATDAEIEAGRIASLRYTEIDRIVWLGNLYLADIDGATELLAPLAEALDAAPDDESALAELDARIADDFASLRLHVLRGWSLGVTELQACALVARAMS